MLTFLGDFKPDYPRADLPFDADAKLVANFECAVSDQLDERVTKAYPIVFEPEALERLSSYPFIYLGIANNHVGDAGGHGFNLLVETLRAQPGFALGGLRADPCPIVEVSGLKVAIIAALEPCRARRPEILPQEEVEAVIRKVRPEVDRIFVLPHWGKEGEYALFPSLSQRELAKSWIAAGADGIFGHHSHTMHGREMIEGKPVYYSLGNFLFDHEESRQHPLTRIALSINWLPGVTADLDTIEVKPITAQNGVVRYLNEAEHQQWALLFDELSRLTASATGITAWITWLRRVGPVYIPKSDKSWKKRRQANAKAWLMCLIWNCLPSTLLLRFGSWFPDPEAVALKQAIENGLATTLAAEGAA
jgi:hypothetical protein